MALVQLKLIFVVSRLDRKKIIQFQYNIQFSLMATRAKYTRVRAEEPKEDKPDTQILMKFSPTYGRYVTRALKLFFGEGKNFVTIKAADRLIERALWVAQVIKRRVEGLHQITELKEHEVIDVYEPKEEGLVTVRQKRFLTVVEVTLTKEPTAAQKGAVGYQAPLKLQKSDFLTKQKWENQQKQREERRNTPKEQRENRDNRDNKRRGEQRTRGNRRR